MSSWIKRHRILVIALVIGATVSYPYGKLLEHFYNYVCRFF